MPINMDVVIAAQWLEILRLRRLSYPCPRHKYMYGSGGIAPLILNLDTKR
jgi:hypothetical protein